MAAQDDLSHLIGSEPLPVLIHDQDFQSVHGVSGRHRPVTRLDALVHQHASHGAPASVEPRLRRNRQ